MSRSYWIAVIAAAGGLASLAGCRPSAVISYDNYQSPRGGQVYAQPRGDIHNIEAKLESWMGARESELIRSWGQPDDQWSQNGQWVMEYYDTAGTSPIGEGPFDCRLYADRNGILVSWSYEKSPR